MSANLVCKAFLSRQPREKKEKLFAHLAPYLRAAFDELPELIGDPTAGFPPLEACLQKIHFSWILPFLRTFGVEEMQLLSSILSVSQRKAIGKELHLELVPVRISKVAHDYFTSFLWERLTEEIEDLLPENCLLSTPLNLLLSFSFAELTTLIDLLGLHDLVVELPKVIDTSLRKAVVEALSPLQRSYLPSLLEKRETLSFAPLELPLWNRDPIALRKTLHQRGLNRFAKALSHFDPHFLWHLLHRLDTGRGHLIEKLSKKTDKESAEQLLQQIIDASSHVVTHRSPS